MPLRQIGFPSIALAPDGVGGGVPSPTPAAPSGGGGEPSSASSSNTGAAPAAGSGASTSPAPAAGPTSTPTPTPTPTPAPATPTPIESSFAGMEFGDDDEMSFPGETPATPAPVVAAAPAVAAPVVPPLATPTPVQPAAPTVAPAATAPATGPQGDFVPSPAEPAKIAAAMLQNEQAFVDHLAATDFALSQEDLTALDTDAPAHIPKLLARMYVKSQAAALNQMQRIVPAMLQSQLKIMARNSANETKFFTRWPEIDKATHGERVSQLARTYRQMNPATSLEQMIEDLGPIVMMTAKIAPGTRPNGNGAVLAPAATPQRSGSPPSPFRPAGTSAASGVVPQPGADQNPWAGLAGPTDEEE